MAATLSELQAQREALVSAINGRSSVRFGERQVTNRSMQEMKEALSLLDDEIAKASSSSSFTLASVRKAS